MLQPERLQPGIAPLKVKGKAVLHLKKHAGKAEKCGKNGKSAARTGNMDKIYNSGPKGRGFESRHFDRKTSEVQGFRGFPFSLNFYTDDPMQRTGLPPSREAW